MKVRKLNPGLRRMTKPEYLAYSKSLKVDTGLKMVKSINC